MQAELHKGDCLEIMPLVPDESVDMILADLPYGTTACKWDTIIPLVPLWREYKRLIKRNGAIVLTASQPFTSALVMSNPAMFRYCLVWSKGRVTGFLDAKRKPLKEHEDICIFSVAQTTYNPQMVQGAAHIRQGRAPTKRVNETYGAFTSNPYKSSEYYPRSILTFSAIPVPIHPTQKPVALMEYLIRTYTNEGETVLDNTMGSGTTGVACVNTERNFIGIEMDPEYFRIAQERIQKAQEAAKQLTMELTA